MNDNKLITKLRYASAALQKVALEKKLDSNTEALFDKIESYLQTVDDSIMDSYAWRMFRDLKNNLKVSRIPQLVEYLSKNGLNPQDNAIPVFRDLKKLQLALDLDAPQGQGGGAGKADPKRAATAKEVQEFLKRLAGSDKAPLRDVVAKLNSLDFRKEAQTVQRFIRDAQGIADTLERVVIKR